MPNCIHFDVDKTKEYITKADILHRKKIDISDLVVVLNVDGYIGKSTRAEIIIRHENWQANRIFRTNKIRLMIERERKFLLKEIPSRISVGNTIKQGYLLIDSDKHLRVRIIDNTKAKLTFKIVHSTIERSEFEYDIPLEDAIQMLNGTNIKLEKTRYTTYFSNNRVDIDIYPNGLQVVEIEFVEPFADIPDYCGDEITGISKYSNIEIAKANSLEITKSIH